MNDRYLRIINLKRPISKKHKPMSIEERASQFGAFQALAGFEDEVKETGKDFENKIENG